MIRILYVTDSLIAGGIESQLIELLTRLDRTRFEAHVVCLYGPRARSTHFAPHLKSAGIPLHMLDLDWGAGDKANGVRQIIRIARALRPDIIQAENYHANLLTRLARPYLHPTKLIGTIRGVHTPKQLLYDRLSHRFCTKIVASAPHLKRLLVSQAHVPAEKVIVIPNSIDVERFSKARENMFRQQIAPGARRVFVSVGRISKQKTMHLIAEALGLLKRQNRLPSDTKVFIVGSVQDAPMQVLLEEVIRREEVSAYLVQCEATDTPEEYYHACDASILFSRDEGIPIVMLESLAAGRPIIASEEANAAEVVEHGVTGWVVPTGDTPALAERLHQVITLPDAELVHMRAACVQRAQHYSVEELVRRYVSLYET